MTATSEEPCTAAPCPFCGGRRLVLAGTLRDGYAKRVDDPDAFAYTVRCLSCAAEGPWWKRKGNALRGWNLRPPPDDRGAG